VDDPVATARGSDTLPLSVLTSSLIVP